MMTQQLNVCVLSAPLAAIDRRALSQAWYSALHCTTGRQSTEKRPRRREKAAKHVASQPGKTPQAASAASRLQGASQNKHAAPSLRGATSEPDRRAHRSPLARRIERKILNEPKTTPRRATFSTGGKRVHVVVQASANRVRLVAVCHPAIREAVVRALAQARFALASRGVTCS